MEKEKPKISTIISEIWEREDRKYFIIGAALFILGLFLLGGAPFGGILLLIASASYCIWRYKNPDKAKGLDKDLREKSSDIIGQVKTKATEIKQSETVQTAMETAKVKGSGLWSKRWFKLALGCIVLLLIGFWIFGGSDGDSYNSSNTRTNVSNVRKCESCGKTYTSDDKYYDSEKGYYISCSSDHCAKCSARISRENDRKALQQGIKKARNKWVDDHPIEARRRGIEKF